MEKFYSERYPAKKQQQHTSITNSIINMINCRRYLARQGFEEIIETPSYGYNNPVINISGTIFFPDGSRVNGEDFRTMKSSSDRDSILERMIQKDISFLKPPLGNYTRTNVIRTVWKGQDYQFTLSVIDTTKEGVIFPISLFILSPKRFAFRYEMRLEKNIINDEDIQKFEQYQKALDEVSRQTSLNQDSTQVILKKPNEKSSSSQSSFINPWDIKIPKIGEKQNE